MKKLPIAASLIAILVTAPGYAQRYEDLSYRHEQGFFADDLQALVKAADIIVVGKYGDFLGNFPFYGYNRDGAQIQRSLGPVAQTPISRFAIPISEYRIIVDQVLKGGNLVPDDLVLRLAEKEERSSVPNVISYRDGNHLFFFNLNPDGRTVGLSGPMFDLKENNKSYFYEDGGKMVRAFEPNDVETFHDEILRLVGQP